jgi:hypothetical protein
LTKNAKPRAPYWHLWTDAEGISHQTCCALTEFEKAAIQPQAAPQWIGAKIEETTTVFVTVLPIGWIGDWHENPKPQWIIPLSGRWFVESMDGQRVEMGPGEMSFGEDMDSRKIGGKQGHLSGTVGDEPALLMIVQSNALSTPASACRFR